jgi:hypothetical protein
MERRKAIQVMDDSAAIFLAEFSIVSCLRLFDSFTCSLFAALCSCFLTADMSLALLQLVYSTPVLLRRRRQISFSPNSFSLLVGCTNEWATDTENSHSDLRAP